MGRSPGDEEVIRRRAMKRTQMSLAKVPNLRQAGKAFLALTALLLLASAALRQAQDVALAQSDYDQSWFTMDGDGGNSEGGSYVSSGTVGQPDAGLALTGGDDTLSLHPRGHLRRELAAHDPSPRGMPSRRGCERRWPDIAPSKSVTSGFGINVAGSCILGEQ
jgi:hypothetical protein